MKIRFGCLVLVLLFLAGGCSSGQEKPTEVERERNMPEQTVQASQKTENPSEIDATSQASINLKNKELIGNTEYFADAIQAEIMEVTFGGEKELMDW